ncbi:unnamed protein product [Anisakis simplex]|uniref:Uncharacterized protein n=1 Tax=Anisakis simplex TaxID=6269 RepID=A0A0M3J0U1_ANISI|nr:unnamed protein product [Anisakis simplex]
MNGIIVGEERQDETRLIDDNKRNAENDREKEANVRLRRNGKQLMNSSNFTSHYRLANHRRRLSSSQKEHSSGQKALTAEYYKCECNFESDDEVASIAGRMQGHYGRIVIHDLHSLLPDIVCVCDIH